ncbi:UPF0220 domain protein, partial [Metarhizium majus ARSEF 297]
MSRDGQATRRLGTHANHPRTPPPLPPLHLALHANLHQRNKHKLHKSSLPPVTSHRADTNLGIFIQITLGKDRLMSQRAQPPTSGTHRPRAPPGAVASAVRPNLFRSQLTRRPTASSSNSADTVRLDVEVLSDSGEIVVRNQQGEIELGDPPTPIPETDEPEDRDESESTLREKGITTLGIFSCLV